MNRETTEDEREKRDLAVCFQFLMGQNFGKSEVMTIESNTQGEIRIQTV